MFIKAIETVKKNNDIHYLKRLKVLQEDLYNTIEFSKLNYYSRITYKLTHILTHLLDIIKKGFK